MELDQVGDECEGDGEDSGVGEGSMVDALESDVEKGGKVEGCGKRCSFCCRFLLKLVKVQEPGEAEPECDALQVPEGPTRLSTLLLKLAYNGCPLKFSNKEGWNYVDEKEKWVNCVPLAVRRRARSLVCAMQKCCWPRGRWHLTLTT